MTRENPIYGPVLLEEWVERGLVSLNEKDEYIVIVKREDVKGYDDVNKDFLWFVGEKEMFTYQEFENRDKMGR